MIISDGRSQAPGEQKGDRVYEPAILPRLQSLLATLADIDIAHDNNLSVIRNRLMDDVRRDQEIADLWQNHCQRRAPFLREIEALRERMDAAFR